MHPLHILLALSVAFTWGANFSFVKMGLEHFPPLFLITLRFALVAALLLPFVPMPRSNQMRQIFLLSIILGTLHFALVYMGMSFGLDVATVIIASQMGVPFSAILGTMLLKDRLGPWRSMGMGIAFLGLVLVAGTPNVTANTLAFLLIIGATMAWAYSNIIIKQMGQVNILQLLGWISLFTTPQLLFLSLCMEQNQLALLMQPTTNAIMSVVFAAVMSTIFGYGIWYWLLRRHPMSQVIPFQLLAPIFGIAISQYLYNEELTTKMLAGGLLTIVGVGIITLRRPRMVASGEGI